MGVGVGVGVSEEREVKKRDQREREKKTCAPFFFTPFLCINNRRNEPFSLSQNERCCVFVSLGELKSGGGERCRE